MFFKLNTYSPPGPKTRSFLSCAFGFSKYPLDLLFNVFAFYVLQKPSGSRTILRLHRALNFILLFFEKLVEADLTAK